MLSSSFKMARKPANIEYVFKKLDNKTYGM